MTQLGSVKLRELFFDRPKVMSAADRATRRVLSKHGSYTQKTAKRSIRKRKGVSKPGTPPSSHSGELRSGIFFVYEPTRSTVIVGPVGFKGSEVPEALEKGGRVRIKTKRRRSDRRRTVRAVVKPRPFMGPAHEKTLERVPEIFRNSVR
jgi:hypothetical protein